MHPNVFAFRIATLSWSALLLLCVAWELWLAPLSVDGSWLWLKALPIALTLPALLRQQLRGLQVALLTSVLYLLEASVRVFEPYPARAWALFEFVLVLVFFAAAVAVLRPLKASSHRIKEPLT